MSDTRPIIGLSSATANQPNTSDSFHFWLAPEVIVNPFDIVEAEQVAPNKGGQPHFRDCHELRT